MGLVYKPEAELHKLQEDKVDRDEYVVELQGSDKGKVEDAKLKIKEKRNSTERTRESSRTRTLDAYRVEAVNLAEKDNLIVYLGLAIQETIITSSSKVIRGY